MVLAGRCGVESLILPHPAEHLIAHPPSQGPDGLGLGIARGRPLLEVVATRARPLQLGHRDAVERGVELAVATLLSSHAGRSDVSGGRHDAWTPHPQGGHRP